MKKDQLIQICHQLGSARILFWTLPILMILLIAGTISQKYIGLHRSLELFFDSWVIWAGPFPLPGFYPVMAVFSVNLLFRFLFKSPWKWDKAGLHLTHFGALLLVIGGLFTALTARESFLVLPEGTQTSFMSDYTNRVLVVFGPQDSQTVLPFEELAPGTKITLDDLDLNILERCLNCAISERPDDDPRYQSMARFMALSPKPLELEQERNMSGLTLEINGQIFIAFEGMPEAIDIEGHQILLGKQQSHLPFEVYLKDFRKEDYAGTMMARNYSSDVILRDGDLEWPVTITMNKPLRYKGYTLYQSSFVQDQRGEQSILHVVQNKGRLFPYLATLIMGAGLLLHLLILFGKGRS